MLATESHIKDDEIEMLSMEHNHAIDLIAELQATLEQEYDNAYQMLTDESFKKLYKNPFTLNLGLIHSILTHLESTCELISLMKNTPSKSILLAKVQADQTPKKGTLKNAKPDKNIENLSSIYLTCRHSPIAEVEKEDDIDPNRFLEKYRHSTEIKLKKAQLREHFLYEVEKGCQSVYTLTLESDPLNQENQVEDIQVLRFNGNMFKNLSVLNIVDSSITDSSIELFKNRFPRVKHLNLSGCYMLTDRAIKILGEEMGDNFVSLALNCLNSIKQESFLSLIESSINLNYLSIKNNGNSVPEDYFIKVYQIYRQRDAQLKWLEITSDHGIDLFINKLMYMTSTNTLEEITDQEFKTLIGQNPPAYTGIFFENCQDLTKASLDLIMEKCKNVKKLGLSKYLHLNDSWLRDLTLCLREILYLDIFCCYNVTDNGLYHISENLVGQKLEYLVLERCMSITDEGLRYILEKNEEIFLTNSKTEKKKIPGTRGSNDKKILEKREREILEASLGTLKHLNISNCKKITDKSLVLLSSTAHALETLDISYCDQITDKPIQLISQRLLNIKSLNLNYCESLTDSSISMLATRLINHLEILEIEWCEVSQQCIRYIAENLVNLKVLNLSYCPSVVSEEVEIIAVNMPQLHTLKLQSCEKISEAAFLKLATTLQNLRVLGVKQCIEVSDTVVKMLTMNNKKLQHLDLSWCSNVSDKALFSIAKNCYCLKSLNLNGCAEITDEGLEWLSTTVSNMEYLNLTLCSKITDIGILEITSHMKELKHLYLTELEMLTDTSIASISNLTKLEQLVMACCTGITNSSLIGLLYNLEKLTELNISQCRSIDGENLYKICQFMANIKILEISEIQINDAFLDEMSVGCPKLKYLNICYCNKISDGAVLGMLEKLPRLVKIDIQNTNIKDRTIGKIFHALNSRKMEQIVLD